METVLDYLKKNGEYEHDVMGRYFKLELLDKRVLLTREDGNGFVISTKQTGHGIEIAIQSILEDDGIEIRFCEECGTPFDAGFVAGDGDWYCCGECFDDAMDLTYGKGKWRPIEDEDVREYGGYYEALDGDEWVDTGVFYTEWY